MFYPDEVMGVLKRRGYKITPQRMLIAKIILENIEWHPSLRDIHAIASRMQPGIGIGTVYNTIRMLEESGLISTFQLEGKLHVDRPHIHANIVCEDTGEIVDAEGVDDAIKMLQEKITRLGIKVNTIIVSANCSKAPRKRDKNQ